MAGYLVNGLHPKPRNGNRPVIRWTASVSGALETGIIRSNCPIDQLDRLTIQKKKWVVEDQPIGWFERPV